MLQTLVWETTPRRTMFAAGFALIILGIAGLAAGWASGDWLAFTTAKGIAFIVCGIVLELVAEVWTAEFKRPVSALFGIATTALGVASIVTDDLGFMATGGWTEGVLYLALGLPQFVALWWPRRFYDYEWGTGWSSGLKFASKPDAHMTSGLDK
jgi:hypothetical protein